MAKHPDDHKTLELRGLSRPGRPTAAQRASTPAERQRAYRQRQRIELAEPDPANMSRVTIVRQLAQALQAIEERSEFAEGAEWQAQKLVAEVIARYGLDWKRVGDWRRLYASRVTKGGS